MARPEGFEPPTYWSEASRSNPLSYGRIHFENLAVLKPLPPSLEQETKTEGKGKQPD